MPKVVERLYIKHKNGDGNKVLELAREAAKLFPRTIAIRHYGSYSGPAATLVIESEYKSLADLEKAWDEWVTLPEFSDFIERWFAVAELTHSEIWAVHDLPE